MHIHEHVPDYWGIITVEPAEGELDFYFLRRPLELMMQQAEKRQNFKKTGRRKKARSRKAGFSHGL